MPKLATRFENILNKIKIKQSLIYVFVFVFFIPFFVIITSYVLLQYKSLKAWELDRIQTNLEITEQNFTELLSTVSVLSNRLIVNRNLQKVLRKQFTSAEEVYTDYSSISYLDEYVHSYKEISSLRIYVNNQTLLDNQFIIKTSSYIENSVWYQRAIEMNGLAFWTYKTDTITKEKYLCMIRSFKDTNSGELLGVIVLNINPDAIRDTLVDSSIRSFFVYDFNIICSSSDKSFEIYEKPIINYLYENDYSISKMTTLTIDEERVGVVAVDFYPKNSVSLKIQIINVFPIKQMIHITRNSLFHTLIIMIYILILMIGVIYTYSKYIDIRVSKINNQLEPIIENNFELAPTLGGNDEFEQIYKTIKKMSVNINDLISKLTDETEKNNFLALQQSEIGFKMLSTQINPHFLFNTLETIRMKALASSDKEVANMLKLLASLLRYNLSVKGQPVPLIKEIEAVQNYLEIQHTRFGNRISYDVVTMCDVQKFEILPLIIQPIVENSFSHGLEDKVSGGFIYILINSEKKGDKENLVITVKDNGCGIDEEKLDELNYKLRNYKEVDTTQSIGIINVQSRIKMFYGEEFGIKIESEIGEGTIVTITI